MPGNKADRSLKESMQQVPKISVHFDTAHTDLHSRCGKTLEVTEKYPCLQNIILKTQQLWSFGYYLFQSIF